MESQELINLVDELRTLPGENEWVEFKSGNVTANDKIGQYISALSNAACIANQPFGYLVFGVENDTQQIVGTNFRFKKRKEGNEELELWLRRLLQPSVMFQVFSFLHGNHYLEIIKIPAASAEPTHFKGISYIRFQSSVTNLRNFPHFVRTIYNSQEDWSAKIIEKAGIENLDSHAIAAAKAKFKEKNVIKPFYHEIDKWDDATFLDKAKITINRKITNTAIILLGKPESTHLISPAVAQITWKLDTEEKAYQHFEPPLFYTINDILTRIRNVNYKFFPSNQLIATEVLKYDPEVILEALNNCIAHQDYGLHSRIVLTEKTGKLIFSNAGAFYEGKADDYSLGNLVPTKYRNRWLANAMVNLNMIDSMGFGIHKMFKSQRQRFFPLPDYSNSSRNEVVLEIYGHSIDENYSKLLIEKKDDLELTEVILLDKVQKGLPITDEAARMLKRKSFIEGRKPNYFISAKIAELTNQKAEYTRNKGLDKEVLMSFVLKHIENHGYATRDEIDDLIMPNLPPHLSEQQKRYKTNNIIQEMSGKLIHNQGSRTKPKWVLLKKN